MASYEIGDRVDLWASAFKVTGVPTDPTTVAVQWGRSGTTGTTWVYLTHAQIARVATGIYSAAVYITAGMTGGWYYKYSGTTACHAAMTGYFEVGVNVFL